MNNLDSVYGEQNDRPPVAPLIDTGLENSANARPPVDQALPEQEQPLLADHPRHEQNDIEAQKPKKSTGTSWRIFASIFVCAEECVEYWRLSGSSLHSNSMKQSAAKHGFYIHWLTIIAVFLNMIDFYVKYRPSEFLQIFLPIVYVILGSIFGWYLWIRPMFRELSRNAHFNSCYVHMIFGFHLIFCAFMLIGYPDLGVVGIIGFQKGVLGSVDLASWILIILWSSFLWKKIQDLGE